MKKIILIKCLEGCANASGPVGAAPERMRPCPFRDMQDGYDPEEDKRETELKISYQEGRKDALLQLVLDVVITLDEIHPYTERIIEELGELYKKQYSMLLEFEDY